MGKSFSDAQKGADGLEIPIVTQVNQEDNPFCCTFSSKRPGKNSELGIIEKQKAASLSLHRAAEHGILHEIEPSLKIWARSPEMINATDPNGDTALHKAARNDHLEICKILCKVLRSTSQMHYVFDSYWT